MGEALGHITIVGGGTAGWMSALNMVTKLNAHREPGTPPVRVTLIESPNAPTVGVGEATVPDMRQWLGRMGINEHVFMLRTNATFKLGVRFVDWNRHPDGSPIAYVHPFEGVGYRLFDHSAAYHYLKYAADDGAGFDRYYTPTVAAIDARHGPRPLGAAPYDDTVNFAYHLDAGRVAEFLKEIALARGAEHIRDDMDDVELDERGFVAALHLRERGRFPVELVIDCTGFRGLIINKALGVPFEDYGHHLLNDRALAVQIPHLDVRKLDSHTRSTALGAGWVWRVPLFNRIGTGYVFSSAHRSDDEAAAEFLGHLGPIAKDAEPRALSMRVGKSARVWEKNCVAIGLSSGFIEPLESTAIYAIGMGLKWLDTYLPDRSFPPALAARYNAMMDELFAEIRDFIVLHYVTSNRDDTDYWRAARDVAVPDSLQEWIDVLGSAIPDTDDFDRGLLFNFVSFIVVLFSKGHYRGRRYAAFDEINRADWDRYLAYLEERRAKVLAETADHYTLINEIRERARRALEPKPVRPAAAAAPGPHPRRVPASEAGAHIL